MKIKYKLNSQVFLSKTGYEFCDFRQNSYPVLFIFIDFSDILILKHDEIMDLKLFLF